MAKVVRTPRAEVAALAAQVDAEVEQGSTVKIACLKAGLAEATYYRWRAAHLAVSGDPTRERRNVQRARRAIEATAKTVFLREGFSASLDGIAELAGVSRKTIYNLYKDKESLFRAVIQDVHNSLHISARILPEDSIRETLAKFAADYTEVAYSKDIIAIGRVTILDRELFPDLFGSITDLGLGHLRIAFAAYLEDLVRTGRIEPVDTEIASDAFVGALRGHARARVLAGLSPPSPQALKAKALFVADWFAKAFVIEAAPTPPGPKQTRKV